MFGPELLGVKTPRVEKVIALLGNEGPPMTPIGGLSRLFISLGMFVGVLFNQEAITIDEANAFANYCCSFRDFDALSNTIWPTS